MSSIIKQLAVSRFRTLIIIVAAVLLFCSAARAQMNDSSGGLGGGGGMDSSANGPNSGSDSDSQNGAVGNAMRRGCIDPSDPNAADSGLPPCTNSDGNAESDQPAQAAPSTLSGGAAGAGGASTMHGGQGFGNAQG